MRTVVCYFDMLDECVAYQIDQRYVPKYNGMNELKAAVSHGTYYLPHNVNPLEMDAADLWGYRAR